MAHPKTRSTPRRRKAGGGTLAGIFIGLVLGVVIALGIALYINKTPLPFQERLGRAAADKADEAKPALKPALPGEAARPAGPMPLPGKPGDKPLERQPPKPGFDFYNILPEGEQAAPAPAPKGGAKVPAAEPLYLQVGAFQDPADADNLKAKLALMGMEASILQVITPDKGTLHRVRVGPFVRTEDMNLVRKELAQNGIQASVVKGK